MRTAYVCTIFLVCCVIHQIRSWRWDLGLISMSGSPNHVWFGFQEKDMIILIEFSSNDTFSELLLFPPKNQ